VVHAEAEEEAEARMGIHMSVCGLVHAESEEKAEARMRRRRRRYAWVYCTHMSTAAVPAYLAAAYCYYLASA
jgi:hypothetical protein